jgi:hypothetical protein
VANLKAAERQAAIQDAGSIVIVDVNERGKFDSDAFRGMLGTHARINTYNNVYVLNLDTPLIVNR